MMYSSGSGVDQQFSSASGLAGPSYGTTPLHSRTTTSSSSNHNNTGRMFSPAEFSFGSQQQQQQQRRRRKFQRHTQRSSVMMGLYAIMVAPLLILTVWAVMVMTTTSSSSSSSVSAATRQQSQGKMNAVRVPVRPHHHEAVRVPVRPHHDIPPAATAAAAAAASPMIEPMQQAAVNAMMRPNVRPRPHPRDILHSTTNKKGSSTHHPNKHHHEGGKLIPIFVPLGNGQYQQAYVMSSSTEAVGDPSLRRPPPLTAEEQPVLPTTLESTPAAGVGSLHVGGAIAEIGGNVLQTTPSAQSMVMMGQQAPQDENAMQKGEVFRVATEESPLLASTSSSSSEAKQIPMPVDPPKVYYYDPNSMMATQDGDGSSSLPETVYDADGNPIPLLQLTQQTTAQIYMEPPPRSAQSPPQEQSHRRAATMSWSDVPNATNVQDQYVIIATVAVMALLVGALSARRLRSSRTILSACIENEDEAAYDTATSTTYEPQGPWRGDLEKFDV